jgi:hypothetical protein
MVMLVLQARVATGMLPRPAVLTDTMSAGPPVVRRVIESVGVGAFFSFRNTQGRPSSHYDTRQFCYLLQVTDRCQFRSLLRRGGCIDFGSLRWPPTRGGESDRTHFGRPQNPDIDEGRRAVKLTQSRFPQHSFAQEGIATEASKRNRSRAQVILTEGRNCIWPSDCSHNPVAHQSN